MKKKILIMAMIAAMSVTALAGCGSDADTSSDTTTSNVTTTSDDTTSSDTVIDDETFAQLKDIYSNLVKLHTTVADAVNDGTIEADAETVDLLNQAADVIKEIGDIEQTDFTDEDEALQLVDSMSKMADGLAAVASGKWFSGKKAVIGRLRGISTIRCADDGIRRGKAVRCWHFSWFELS